MEVELATSPIYFMIEKFIFRKSTTVDNGVEQYCLEHEIEAYRIKNNIEDCIQYKKNIRKQTDDKHYYHSIDKLTFVYSADYLDSYVLSKSVMKKGAVTIDRHGKYFNVQIHNEYIPINENLESFIKDVFKYLVYYKNLFILPLKKITYNQKTGVVNVCINPENDVKTEEEFFDRIYSMRKLKCIELCFDMHINIRKYFDKDVFNYYKGTLYSNADYRVYGSKNIKKSMLCIYDKAKQLQDEKNTKITCTLERFELRLFTSSFVIMKNSNENGLLNCTYYELVKKMTPYIRKYLRKLNIDFNRFLNVLPDIQIQLRKILENL